MKPLFASFAVLPKAAPGNRKDGRLRCGKGVTLFPSTPLFKSKRRISILSYECRKDPASVFDSADSHRRPSNHLNEALPSHWPGAAAH